MKQEELQAIKELLEKVTPGPWIENIGCKMNWEYSSVIAEGGIVIADRLSDGDARFIATAHKNTSALIAEIERLSKALEFYADTKTYETDVTSQWEPVTPINQDAGEIARKALDGEENEI